MSRVLWACASVVLLMATSLLIGGAHATCAPFGYDTVNSVVLEAKAALAIVVADFNNDGFEDIAFANGTGINVKYSNAGRTFFPAAPLGFASCGPRTLELAAIASPTSKDLVTMCNSDNSVSYFANFGTSFSARRVLFVGIAFNEEITVGDFKGDGGAQDLLVWTYSYNSFILLFNNGTGTMSSQPTTGFATGLYNKYLVTLRLQANSSATSIVGFDTFDDDLTVYTRNGTGSWSSIATTLDGGPMSAVEIDYNLDGYPDLMASIGGVATIVLFRNNKGVLNLSPILVAQLPSLANAHRMIAVDFNGDGSTDVAYLGNSSPDIGGLVNDGAGLFTLMSIAGSAYAYDDWAAIQANPAVDSFLDFVGVQQSPPPAMRIYYGTTASTAAPVATIMGTMGFAATSQVFAVLVDSDLLLDIVTIGNGFDGNPIAWIRNRGDGTFANAVRIATPGGSADYDLFCRDFDGTGTVDILYLSTPPALALVLIASNGDGTFAAPQTVFANASLSTVVHAMLLDINADGALDFVPFMYGPAPSAFLLYPSPGIGRNYSSAAAAALFVPSFTGQAQAADLDGNGRPDFVQMRPGYVSIYPNTGSLTGPLALLFGARVDIAVASGPNSLLVERIDAVTPGSFDLLVQDGTNGVQLYRGLAGAFTFTGAVRVASCPGTCFYTIGDANFDGLPDLLIALYSSDLTLQVQNATGGFSAPVVIESSSDRDQGLIFIDMQRTGFPDPVAFQFNSGGTIIWINVRPTYAARPERTLDARPSAGNGFVPNGAALYTAVAGASTCWQAGVTLSTNITGCKTGARIKIGSGLNVAVSGANPFNRPTIRCAADGSQSLFEVADGGRLALSNVNVDTVPFAPLPPGRLSSVIAAQVASGVSHSLLRVSQVLETTSISLSAVRIANVRYLTSNSLAILDTGFGGALAVNGAGTATIANCAFINNVAPVGGGAIALVGSGAAATISSTTFVGCSALGVHSDSIGGGGGAIAVVGANVALTLTTCNMTGSAAPTGSGGALLIFSTATGASVSVAGSRFASSSAGAAGGAIAVVGAAGAAVSISGATTVTGSTAGWGGALAAMSLEQLGTPLQATTSTALMPSGGRIGSTPGGTLSVGPGFVLGSASAACGGAVFACNALVNLTAGAVSDGAAFSASVAGGFGFACSSPTAVPSDWMPRPSTGNVASVSTAGGYGPLQATPAVSIAVSGLPESSQSGVSLGSGAASLVDAFGQIVVDPLASLRCDASGGTGSVSVHAAPVLAPLNVASQSYALGSMTVSLSEWPASLGSTVQLTVAIDGGGAASSIPGSPTTVAAVVVGGCAAGWGRVSLDGATVPLVCALCSDQTFSVASSAAAGAQCISCPVNTIRVFTNETDPTGAATPHCVCKNGFYSPGGVMDVACLPCPEGGVCVGGTNPPTAAPGFFPDTTTGGTVFVSCFNPAACTGSGRCARGYVGRLCGKCAPRWYSVNGRCYPCNFSRTVALSLVLVLLALLLVAALVWFNLTQSVTQKFVAAMIGLTGLQVAALYGKLEFDWGPFAIGFFQVVSALSLNLELTSPECSAPNSLDPWTLRFVLTMLLPAFSAIAILLVCAAVFAPLIAAKVGRLSEVSWPQLADGALRSWYQTMVLMYLPLTAAAFSVFGCTRDVAGEWVFVDDPSRNCYNARWWKLFFPGLLFSLLYGVAFPAALVALMFKARRAMDELAFTLRYGFLVARFRGSHWYFEGAIMALKLGIVLCMTFMASTDGKASMTLFVLVAFLVQLCLSSPYGRMIHNRLAMVVQAAVAAVLFGGLLRERTLRLVVVDTGLVVIILAIIAGNLFDLWLIATLEAEAAETFKQVDLSARESEMDDLGSMTSLGDSSVSVQHTDGRNYSSPHVMYEVSHNQNGRGSTQGYNNDNSVGGIHNVDTFNASAHGTARA